MLDYLNKITTVLFDIPLVVTYFYTGNTLEIGTVRTKEGYNIKPMLSDISLIRILATIKVGKDLR